MHSLSPRWRHFFISFAIGSVWLLKLLGAPVYFHPDFTVEDTSWEGLGDIFIFKEGS